MSEKHPAVRLQLTATAEQMRVIDAFQDFEKLSTRTEALKLLLEIALDSITGDGRRFWDKPVAIQLD